MKKNDYYDGDVSGDLTWADIPNVHPKFRKDCWEALDRGERVPKSVVLLTSRPPTEKEIEYAKSLIPLAKHVLSRKK